MKPNLRTKGFSRENLVEGDVCAATEIRMANGIGRERKPMNEEMGKWRCASFHWMRRVVENKTPTLERRRRPLADAPNDDGLFVLF